MKNNIKETINKYLEEVLLNSETRSLAIIFALVNTFILVIDIINVPSKLIKEYSNDIFIVIVIALIIISTISFWDKHLLDLILKIKYVNTMDRILFISLVCNIVTFLFVLFLKIGTIYKYIILTIDIVSLLLLLNYRINKCKSQKSYNNNLPQKFFDLKDIFYNEISKNEGPILISDKDVYYDLFERNGIINQLYRSIVQCTSCNDSFVIGLEGEWGVGKTTILNNLKNELSNNKDIIIVDNFDLWTYETQEALLLAMFQVILDKSNIKYNIMFSKEIINTITSLIGSDKKMGTVIKNLLFQESFNNDVSKIKKQIEKYLCKHNVSIVFFIDNIDRANANNIIFLFKIINIILDIENVTYVLSYDKARIGRILENTLEIDPHFTEKIIQQEIKVPKLTFDGTNDVLKVCANNIMLSYGVLKEDICKYELAIKYMLKNISNVRTFKIIINSIFSDVFSSTGLYKPDLLSLELIRYFDCDLYEKIYTSSAYFISCDNVYDAKISKKNPKHIPDKEEKKAFYDNLFKDKNESTIELLSSIFIYIDKYFKKDSIEVQRDFKDASYADISLNSKPESAKYFDLYFNRNSNEYLRISNLFEQTMRELNDISENQYEDYFTNSILGLKEEYQRQWLENLHMYKNQIQNGLIYPILKVLLINLNTLNNTREGFSISARTRAVMIICDLICKLNSNEQKSFLSQIEQSYSTIFVLRELINSLKEEKLLNELKKIVKQLCSNIIRNKINIYDDEFYSKDNVFTLYYGMKLMDDISGDIDFKNYISSIITSKNVYRVLADAIIMEYGNMGYYYDLNRHYMELMFENTSDIKKLIDSNPAKSEAEKFIEKLYNKFDSKDAVNISTISEKPIKFDL